MLRKQRLPGWLGQLMNEMMKPPYFLDQVKQGQSHKQASPENTAESKQTSDERSTSQVRNTNKFRAEEIDNMRRSKSRQTPNMSVKTEPRKSGHETGTITTATASIQKKVNGPSEVVTDVSVPPAVLSQYGWKVTKTEPVYNITRVYTEHDSFAVKKTHIQPQHVKFLHQVLRYAKKNGFTRFSPFVLTKRNNPYVRRDGQTFYATSWLNGTSVNFASVEHVGQTAYTLAQFYESTRGFQFNGDYQPESAFQISQMTEQRNRDLRQLLRMVEAKEEQDEFDKTLLKLKPQLLDDAAESLNLLRGADCEAFLKEEQKQPGICHLDVIPGNFIYDKNHQVHVLDFDLATFAPRVLDISHLLRRSMQQVNWKSEMAYTCFLHYNAAKTMPKVEYTLVQAILTFPYRAWRLAHTRYRFFAAPAQVDELKAYDTQEERRHAFLEEFAKQVDGLGLES